MFGAACMQRRKKTGIYEFRRVVPERLRPVIGKREVVRSLGTKDAAEAKIRNKRVGQEVDDLFTQAEAKLAASEAPLVWDDPAFTLAHAEALAAEWLQERLAADATRRAEGPPLTEMSAFLQSMAGLEDGERVRAAVSMRHYDLVAAFVTPIVDKHSLPFASHGPAWRRLASAVARATKELVAERDRRAKGDWPLAVPATPALPFPPVALGKPAQPTEKTTFGEVFENYVTERALPPDTEKAYRTTVRLLHDILGTSDATPVAFFEKSHIRDFKLALLKLPSRRHGPHLRRLSVEQLIKFRTEHPDVPGMTERTVNKHIDFMRAVFGYAVDNEYISANPASNMSIKNSKRVQGEKRSTFSEEDLRRIFTSPLFQEDQWEGRQWLPVIALYMGCRLEEIGQLFVEDVRTARGISYLAIRGEAGGEQSVKTQASIRDVPLHPVLLKLGFLDYVAKVRRTASRRLFPDITSRRNKVTAAYSTWFGRYLDKLSIRERLKVFHSFRHTFKDACREAGIDPKVAIAFTGHADDSVAESYGHGYSLKHLFEKISLIRYGLPWEGEEDANAPVVAEGISE